MPFLVRSHSLASIDIYNVSSLIDFSNCLPVNVPPGTCVALRHAGLEAGYGFPCGVMTIASAMGPILFPFPHYFRAAKAVVVSRPDLRRRFMVYFSHRAMRMQVRLQ
jgi:uncharacterized protein with von Willebrand factor type A (vWA) domain